MSVASRSFGDEASWHHAGLTSENYGCRGAAARRRCHTVPFFDWHRRHRIKRRQLTLGSYLTDGERLFRVTSLFAYASSTLVSIDPVVVQRAALR